MAMCSSASMAYDPLADTSQLIRAVVFGPNVSRRLGHVLGINLLPPGEAFCTYRCVYCPLSPFIKLVSSPTQVRGWLSAEEITRALAHALELVRAFREVDALVLIGNGEPTLYPDLGELIPRIGEARDTLAPRAKLAIFTNSSLLADEEIARALSDVDYVVAKLDAVDKRLWEMINRPHPALPSLRAMIEGLKRLGDYLSDGEFVISISALELQNGISNLNDAHLKEMASVLMEIRPDELHIEVPPVSPLSVFRPPSREALIRAATKLSIVVRKAFLLLGTSSPIPSGLLRRAGLCKELGEARVEASIPEPIRAFLSEGPGAETRLRLLEALSGKKMSCNRLARELGMSWWAVKKHIERLVELGLVRPIPFGKRTLYAITPLGLSALLALKGGTGERGVSLRLL